MEKNILGLVLQEIVDKVNATADSTGQKIEDFIQNEEALRPILIAAYSRLPFFLRIILKEDRFVVFVMQNREKLLIQREISFLVSRILNKFK